MKNLAPKIVIVLVLIIAIAGGYEYPKFHYSVGVVSPAGTTNSTFQIASVNITPLTAAATSTSLLNNTTIDRSVTGLDIFCQGLGVSNQFSIGQTGGLTLSNLVLQTATTTVPNEGFQGASSLSIYASTTIATTTPLGTTFTSTSTEGVVTGINRIWPAGTYWTIDFNATNTAACTVSTKFIAL